MAKNTDTYIYIYANTPMHSPNHSELQSIKQSHSLARHHYAAILHQRHAVC